MKIILILLSVFLFAGCFPSPNYIDSPYQIAAKRCERLKYNMWSRILAIEWEKISSRGESIHYVCVYIRNFKYSSNPVYDELFVYDPILGDKKIPIRYRESPIMQAKFLFGDGKVKNAWFIEY